MRESEYYAHFIDKHVPDAQQYTGGVDGLGLIGESSGAAATSNNASSTIKSIASIGNTFKVSSINVATDPSPEQKEHKSTVMFAPS